MCSYFGTFSMLVFWLHAWLNLHVTYVTRPAPVPSESESAVTKAKKQLQNIFQYLKSVSCCTLLTGVWTTFRPRALFHSNSVTAFTTSFDLPVRTFYLKLVSCRHFVTGSCMDVVSWVLFDPTLIAGFCTKLLCYHCGFTSLSLTVVTFFTFCELYKTISIWAHGEDHKDDGNYRFERGDANTQLESVRHKWRVFSLIFSAAALCTMGQLHTTPPSTVVPETISHVFCKMNNKTQLECVVNSTYYNPSEPKTHTCFCNSTAPEWDFCGK